MNQHDTVRVQLEGKLENESKLHEEVGEFCKTHTGRVDISSITVPFSLYTHVHVCTCIYVVYWGGRGWGGVSMLLGCFVSLFLYAIC